MSKRQSQTNEGTKTNGKEQNDLSDNSQKNDDPAKKADQLNEDYEEGDKEEKNEEDLPVRNIPRKRVETLEKSLNDAKNTVEKLTQQNKKLDQEWTLLNHSYKDILAKITPKIPTKGESNQKGKKTSKQEAQEDPANNKEEVPKKERKKLNQTGDPEIDSLFQEVEKKNLEVNALIKEINLIKNKADPQGNIEKVADLENTVTDRDREIERLTKEKSKLENANTEQEKLIKSLNSDKDFKKKIEELKNECKKYKDDVKAQQRRMNENEIKYKKQVNYVTVLKAKLREVCSNIGASSSINKDKAEKYDKIKKSLEEDLKTQGEKYNKLKKKRDMKGKEDKKEEIPPEFSLEFSDDNCRLIVEKITENKRKLQSDDKTLAKESESLQARIRELEFQKRDLLNKLKEKDLEANIAVSEFNKMKRINKTNFIQLDPLEKSTMRSSTELIAKKPLIKQVKKNTSKKRTRREVAGNLEGEGIIAFDDAELLLDNVDQKIVEVTIYHDESKLKIYGFQALYSLYGQSVKGYCNINYDLKNSAKTTVLKITEQDDYLRFISGFYSDSIEYLKLETQKGVYVSVGIITSKDKQKEFRLDIKKDEQPIILYGGLDYKKNCSNSKELQLVYIGAELDNSFYNQSRKARGLNKSADEIEEILASDDENFSTLTKRGLVQSRVVPNKSGNRYKL